MRYFFAALMLVCGWAHAAVTNVYWRVDLHQGSYIIAYGQGATEQAAWDDCVRLKAITRAMTAAETRRNAVAAITAPTVRWCQNPKRYATVAPDPVTPTPVPGAGEATLHWQHATPPLTRGFDVRHGTSPTALNTVTPVLGGAAARETKLTNLPTGVRYFAIVALGYCSGTPGSPVDPYRCADDSLPSSVVSKVVP